MIFTKLYGNCATLIRRETYLKPVNLLNPLLLFSSVEDFYIFNVEIFCVITVEEELVFLEKNTRLREFFWVQQPEEGPNPQLKR